MLAISVDPVEENLSLAGKLGLDFALLSDPEAVVIERYGVLHAAGGMGGVDIARPALFVVDRDGRIVWRNLTENWRVRVRPDEVVRQLESLP